MRCSAARWVHGVLLEGPITQGLYRIEEAAGRAARRRGAAWMAAVLVMGE